MWSISKYPGPPKDERPSQPIIDLSSSVGWSGESHGVEQLLPSPWFV